LLGFENTVVVLGRIGKLTVVVAHLDWGLVEAAETTFCYVGCSMPLPLLLLCTICSLPIVCLIQKSLHLSCLSFFCDTILL